MTSLNCLFERIAQLRDASRAREESLELRELNIFRTRACLRYAICWITCGRTSGRGRRAPPAAPYGTPISDTRFRRKI